MPRKIKPLVVVRPPFDLIQPRPVTVLPAEDAMLGAVQFEVKLDGVRAAAWRGPEGVELWSRRQHQLTSRYPEIVPALNAALPVGTTLDGEICAWNGTRLDFHQLLRSPANRQASGVALSFVTGGRDLQPG
ncbi:hypothetical protein [Kitasatospora sp. Root107]|uniref:ATP-dependent DNA ligase n=1 Tax=Kitasatospora sp. Root107 TaxID=1736424 RepID=UPI00070FACAD|nr:hypothetical protein [Kitasatospora sp. Root107]KQV11923.1 hypothetical protein ASC99_35710 [Kitasatospora sp. Root107]